MELVDSLVKKLNLDVLARIDLPGRAETRKALPDVIRNGPLASYLAKLRVADSVWAHQAIALEQLVAGSNTVVATGTASGKSLIFQLYALHLVRSDPNAKILVFYPLKALASDQHQRWNSIVKLAGLPETCVAKIDGDVPSFERDALLQRANIVLMTPDVCQAWFMRGIGGTSQRHFLANLQLLVLDEAHTYESVFGSNVAMLLRRLLNGRRLASKANPNSRQLQILAATATISQPAEHLEALTGRKFEVIAEEANGAPQYPRVIMHINGAERGAAGESDLGGIVEGLRDHEQRHRFIAFIDSRQGTERVARHADSELILPYRSGYEASDREQIEKALRSGKLHGVISTSALELGIDIPDMEIGVNLGVPSSRKSFRQRIGRVGRSGPGIFLLIAPPTAFTQFGETFQDYYDGSVEPSYLYTGNRFLQYAHARCLYEEMDVLGQEKSSLPAGVAWPEGFENTLKIARPGAGRPREFDLVAQLGANDPHLNYPLRQIGEATFEIKLHRSSDAQRIGTIASNQAIREAFPGANYLHAGQAYKVVQWLTSSFERSIRVEPAHAWVPTRPILRKTVTFALDHSGIIEGRIKRAGEGLVAEVQLQVNEAVEGYTIGSSSFLYRDLRVNNPNLARRQRDIRTTGIVVRLNEVWFAGGNSQASSRRESVAQAFMQLLCRERSVAPSDVDCAFTNIAVMTDGAPKKISDAIVIYDTVYGGLRLTEDLYHRFSEYAAQLDRAAGLAGRAALVPDDVTERIKLWAEQLETADVLANPVMIAPGGMYMVYKPGSTVGMYFQGVLVSREIVAPRLIDLMNDGQKQLAYIYDHNGRKSFVSHEEIQPIDGDSQFIYWNPEENTFHELDEARDETATEHFDHDAMQRVFRPGSIVMIPHHGTMVKRTLLGPRQVADRMGRMSIQYEYSDDNGVGLVMHDQIQTTGADWGLIGWDPLLNQFKELAS